MCCALCALVGPARASEAQAGKAPTAATKTPATPATDLTDPKEPPPDTEPSHGFPDEIMDDEEDYLVQYADGHLTVDVLDMPLEDLLKEVGRQSGARVRLEGLGDRTVTDTFTRLSLDAALRRLVTGRNFSITYAEQRDPKGKVIGTRLKELTVYGGTGSASTYRPRSRGTGTSGPTAAGPGARRSGRGRPQGADGERKAAGTTPKSGSLDRQEPQQRELAETPEGELPEYANPVTAAILGRRGVPKEPAPPIEPVPAHEEVLPFPDELTPLHEEVPPLHEELTPFHDEVPPLDEGFEGDPTVEDEWYPEFEEGEVVEDDGAAYEGSEYE